MCNKVVLSVITILFFLSRCSFSQPPVSSFSNDGHTVYHLKPATVDKNEKRGVISAAYDGFVLSHNEKGILLLPAGGEEKNC